MKNVRDTILTQYAASPNIRSLIESFNTTMDMEEFTDEFLTAIWDVSTATGYGLDVWGKIVGVPRLLNVRETATYFGFDESYVSSSDDSPKPFDEAPFFEGVQLTTTVRLSDDGYRKLIMAKAMANITDCSIPALNSALSYLFGDEGNAFVAITGIMSMSYVFDFNLSPVEWAILLNSSAIAKPAGVSVSIMSLDFNNTFGFSEAGLQPFESGNLFPDSGIQNANQLTA
ncbi:DUF2612 domain-containing protein [Pantoea piersonii]|jgi:hypothetical protein|uniref:DUF2612 domain-containing protein n=1 Tax=Pantoea piersonii TaxID=2364647 RepID=UPI000EA00CDB|nr:DUF2612 domain-containing protein [Pantoea piersonii]MBZ6385160.1 DUF2612 domain-containing protein [Pantoea piersonii]MBZ6385236.1 DUF2612 domain-containing protein [Pantoea piersonii]MBZ6398688.1 DUF2612 domain-containing protein [Pantoea piersonii]MBZ6398764.1 DUF2612 domain-containing protein [Pantoea piersonii]MBZ6406618.1 DUF2612 domain-containing protein [Pantoea piersonii]